jgi:hypothetical protein
MKEAVMTPTKKPPVAIDLRDVFGARVDRLIETPEQAAERKKVSARCGHIKRRLLRKEPLRGELLEFALGIVGNDSDIGTKLRGGQTLDAYELHLMLDVFLLHARLR